jgi:hypothetical protein
MIDFDKISDLSFMIEDYDFKKNKKICVKYKKKINITKKRSFNVKLERKRFRRKNSCRD